MIIFRGVVNNIIAQGIGHKEVVRKVKKFYSNINFTIRVKSIIKGYK